MDEALYEVKWVFSSNFQLAKRVSRSHFFVSSLHLIIFPIFLYFLPPKGLEPLHYQSYDSPKQHLPLPLPPCPQSPLIFSIFSQRSHYFFLSHYLLFKILTFSHISFISLKLFLMFVPLSHLVYHLQSISLQFTQFSIQFLINIPFYHLIYHLQSISLQFSLSSHLSLIHI